MCLPAAVPGSRAVPAPVAGRTRGTCPHAGIRSPQRHLRRGNASVCAPVYLLLSTILKNNKREIAKLLDQSPVVRSQKSAHPCATATDAA